MIGIRLSLLVHEATCLHILEGRPPFEAMEAYFDNSHGMLARILEDFPVKLRKGASLPHSG